MINYRIDKKEFIYFIDTGTEILNHMYDCRICVNRVCSSTGEEFLDNRANYFKCEINTDKVLDQAFKKLTAICNENERNCYMCPVSRYCNTFINLQKENIDCGNYKIMDLFCGAGGLSLGFKQEGFITGLANDIQECCIDTYAYNHPEVPRKNIILGDISLLSNTLHELCRYNDIDVIVGGPPCQGFSRANRQRLIDDPRNRLYKYYISVVSNVNPKFVVMENVRGILKHKDEIIDYFNKIGHRVSVKVLNTKDYGVPQNRERAIFIGNRLGINNDAIFETMISNSTEIPKYTLGDALYGLRKLEASRIKNMTIKDTHESGYIIEKSNYISQNDYLKLINQEKESVITCNHKARYNNDRDIEIFGRLNPGDKSNDPKIADIMPYTNRSDIFLDKYFKLEENKVCKTITAHMKCDCNMYIHPSQARGLTPREAARVQSFPDDYYFRGAYTKTYMQIGNSVPPLLGRNIAKVIKKYLDDYNKTIEQGDNRKD
jgi:DNA (cytosine-5)-methyltransferase 1